MNAFDQSYAEILHSRTGWKQGTVTSYLISEQKSALKIWYETAYLLVI